jgi:hypothetical protein
MNIKQTAAPYSTHGTNLEQEGIMSRMPRDVKKSDYCRSSYINHNDAIMSYASATAQASSTLSTATQCILQHLHNIH